MAALYTLVVAATMLSQIPLISSLNPMEKYQCMILLKMRDMVLSSNSLMVMVLK